MKLISYLKRDEKSAPTSYRRLLKQLHTKTDKARVRGIIRDERRHLRILKQIKRR